MAQPVYKTPAQVADDISPPGSSPLERLLGDLDNRPTHTIPFPGYPGHEVALWALTDDETRRAEESALRFFKTIQQMPIEHAKECGLYGREQRVQILTRAMRHPEPGKAALPFAGSEDDSGANKVRKLLPDVQDAVFMEYITHLEDRSPLRKLDPNGLDAHIDALVDALGKGEPVGALLSCFDTGTLHQLIIRSAQRLIPGTKDNSSGSSAASDGPVPFLTPPQYDDDGSIVVSVPVEVDPA